MPHQSSLPSTWHRLRSRVVPIVLGCLSLATMPLIAQDKVGINFNYRDYRQENGNNTDPTVRPWVWADSVNDATSLANASNPWNQAFLDDLQNFAYLRPMEWGPANNHPVSKWNNRRRKSDWPQKSVAVEHPSNQDGGESQTTTYIKSVNREDSLRTDAASADNAWGGALGIAWEWVIDLSNRTGKPLWVNVPHRANNDYVDNLATLLRDNITNNRTIYVEYTNEVWNSGPNFFGQNRWCFNNGNNSSLAGLPSSGTSIATWLSSQGNSADSGLRAVEGYYAWRSAQVWKRFYDVFNSSGKAGQLKFMLCGPTNNQGRLEVWKQILSSSSYNPGGKWPDYVCTGVYVGLNMAGGKSENSSDFWSTFTGHKDAVFQSDYSGLSGDDKNNNIAYNKAQLTTHFSSTAKLGCYELGFDLPNYVGQVSTWRDGRMYDFWRDLTKRGGQQFEICGLYSYTAVYDSYAKISGLKEKVGQDSSGTNAPMWRGAQQGLTDLGGGSGGSDDITSVTPPTSIASGSGTARVSVTYTVAGSGRHFWTGIYDANNVQRGSAQVDHGSSGGTQAIDISYSDLTAGPAGIWIGLKNPDWSSDLDQEWRGSISVISAITTPTSGTSYFMKNAFSGKYLSANGGSDEWIVPLQGNQNTSWGSQKWRFTSVSSGGWTISPEYPANRTLTANSSTTSGSTVFQAARTDGWGSQEWTITVAGTTIVLSPKWPSTDLALACTDANEWSNILQVTKNTGDSKQQWTLETVP